MIANGPRPMLNTRAHIKLETPIDIRSDHLLQAANDIDKLYVKEWHPTEALNDIVLDSDRVSMGEIDELVNNLYNFGYELDNTDLRLASKTESTRIVTGLKAAFGGNGYSTEVTLQIPSNGLSKKDIRNVFTISGGAYDGKTSVDISSKGQYYMLEPSLDIAFMLSTGHDKTHWSALNRLGVSKENAVYAASVVER